MDRPIDLLIALGGNAILQAGERGTAEEQRCNIRTTCRQVASLVKLGYRVVLSHGNGPQVGQILLQNELAAGEVPPMPLDLCGAQTQGALGYMLQQELQNELAILELEVPVVTLITQVLVDPDDPAFGVASKPIGSFYDEAEAEALRRSRGWQMRFEPGKGWRRVVPSPAPLGIVESAAVRALVEAGQIVIACGGGGVPVIRTKDGLRGVEGVVDKDLAALRLAQEVGARRLLIATDVSHVSIRHGEPDEQPLQTVTTAEAERFLAQGHFPPGSMEAKVRACLEFVRSTGGEAFVAPLTALADALAGKAGTRFMGDVPELANIDTKNPAR